MKMDKIFIIGGIVFIFIIFIIFLMYFINKDEKDIENSKCVILFNRRTREIKEVLNSKYIESLSWERIAIVYESKIDSFIIYLKQRGIINEKGRYLGKSSNAINFLRLKFKHFTDEISEV